MLFTFQYVPICFYYFSFYDTITDFVSKIYIPICFYYFPSIPSALIPSRSSFTFQYVSIISFFPPPEFVNFWLIYIPICFYYFRYFLNGCGLAHLFTFQYVSIISMELTWISVRHRFIYIPICFYYFRYKFWASKCSKGNLHSNMFLLFRSIAF